MPRCRFPEGTIVQFERLKINNKQEHLSTFTNVPSTRRGFLHAKATNLGTLAVLRTPALRFVAQFCFSEGKEVCVSTLLTDISGFPTRAGGLAVSVGDENNVESKAQIARCRQLLNTVLDGSWEMRQMVAGWS